MEELLQIIAASAAVYILVVYILGKISELMAERKNVR